MYRPRSFDLVLIYLFLPILFVCLSYLLARFVKWERWMSLLNNIQI